jgi:hypothetical protein
MSDRFTQTRAEVTAWFFDSLPKEIGNALAGSGLNTSSGVPFDQLLTKGSRGYTDYPAGQPGAPAI